MADLASLVIKVDSRSAKGATDDLKKLESASKRVDGSVERMGSSARGASLQIASMSRVLGAAAAVAAVAGIRSFVTMSDTFAQLQSRLKLVTSATEDYAKIQKSIVSISRENLQSLSATSRLYTKLSPALKALGKSSDDTLQVVDAFGKALRIGGAGASEAASATLQFSQALASGVLRGDEFNSIAEASPRILKAIADGSGFAAGELRKLAADGVLSAELVSNALQSQLGVLEAESKKIPSTVGGAFQVFNNEILLTVGALNEAAGVTDVFKSALTGISEIVASIGATVVPVFEQINTIIKTTDGTIGAVKDTLKIAAGAAAGFAIAMNIGSVVGIATIAMTGLVAQGQIATAGMTAAAVATGAFRAALTFLAAHPAVIVFATIGAGIAYVNSEYDKMNRKSEQDMANNNRATASIKSLNDERERLAKIGNGVTAQQAVEIEAREQAIQQLKDELKGTENATQALASAIRVYDENAAKRKELAQAAQEQATAATAAAKAEKEAATAAEKAAAKIAAAKQKYADTRENFANQIADTAEINRLALSGLGIEEARARVQLLRQGANATEIEALLEQQRIMQNIAEAERIQVSVSDGFAADIIKELEQSELAAEKAAKAFDDYLNKDYGANLAAGFDAASASLGQFVSGFDKLIEISADYDKARAAAAGYAKKLAKIDAKNAAAQIGAYADITGAAKGFFKEGSKGYKALQAAEQAFRVFQIAMSAKELAVKLGALATGTAADTAATGVEVANAGTRAAADGVAAQAKALSSAPPPANFALLAAVTAALVGIGVAVGGGRESGPGFIDNNGTGTVFGDPSAQSESITKSIDLLADAATLENRISSAMLASLKNIEANISGLTNLIIRSGGAAEGLAAGVNTGFKTDAIGGLFEGIGKSFDPIINVLSFGLLDGLGSAIGKLIGGLFGSKTKITGQGLTAVPQALESILNDGFSLLEFVAIQTKKKSFGITTSTKNSIRTSLADPELTNQFSLIFSGFADSIRLAGDALNRDVSGLNSAIIDIGKINLRGLKGEEIQEKLTAVFGAAADKLAQTALGGLDDFQRVGEGYFETVVRVASGVEQAGTLLDRLGLSAIAYTDILNKQGDVSAEIVRQSVLLTELSKGVAGGFAEIVQNAQGSAVELVDLVQQLRELQNAIVATGKAGEYLTTFMIAGAGGIDRLTDGLSTYFDEFLTPSEQVAELTRRMGNAFQELNLSLPGGIDGFRELVEGIDITTEAGQKLYGQVIALAPAFSQLQDALQGAVDDAQRKVDSARSAVIDAYNREKKALEDVIAKKSQAENALRSAFNEESRRLQANINQFDELFNTIGDFIKSLTTDIASASIGTLAQSRREFNSLITRARLGDVEAMRQIPQSGAALAGLVGDFATSSQDQARQLAQIRNQATLAQDVAGKQKTGAEIQLSALRDQVALLISIDDGVISVEEAIKNLSDAAEDALAAQMQLDALTEQLTALGLLNESTLSVEQAVRDLEAAMRELLAAQAALRNPELAALGTSLGNEQLAIAMQNPAAVNSTLVDASSLNAQQLAINSAYQQALGRNADIGGLNFYQNSGRSLAQIIAEIENSPEARARRAGEDAYLAFDNTVQSGIAKFATGGMHEGGWRVVGENGPELEYTGPSRIFNAGQTSSMLNNDDLKQEMVSLRSEMRQALYTIAKNTGKTVSQLERWDDGDRLRAFIDNDAQEPVITRDVA